MNKETYQDDTEELEELPLGRRRDRFFNEETGWWLEKTTSNHQGDWILMNDQNERVATVDKNGKIIGD